MHRSSVWCTAMVCCLISSAFAGVNVSSPTNGSTVSSPTHFVASASSNHPIIYMRIYVDNVSVYGVAAASLSTYVSMSTGSHSVTVQAWDSGGGILKTPLTLKIGTSSSGGGGIPSNAKVFSKIEEMTGWQNCDGCAGPGGVGPSTPHWMAQYQTTPSLDGASAQFFLGGATPYAAALWWKQLGPIDTATHFVYDLYYLLKDANAAQALEFDVNQSVGGKKYIFGTECDFKGYKHWRIWDYYLHWQDTGITCTGLAANVWHHLVWEFERTSDGHTHFIAVTVDGARQTVNRYYRPQPTSAHELNAAFQMDGNSAMTDYYVWVDKIKLSVW